MHYNTTVRPGPSPLIRFFLAIALAGATLSGGTAYSRIAAEAAHPAGSHLSAAQASRRMLTLCNQYDGPCEILATPFYQDDTNLASPPYTLHRKVWQGMLHSNGQIVHMVVNDLTGNLAGMYYGGEAAKTSVKQFTVASVSTPLQAARLSLRYLRALEIVPANAQVALSGKPDSVHSSDQWWVYWKVRSARGKSPDLVKAALSSRDGKVQLALDHQQMGHSQ